MPPPPSEDPFDRFEEDLVRKDRSPLTHRNYCDDLRLFARWIEESYGEPLTVSSVTARDLAGFKTHLLSALGRKPATVNRKLAALSAFFRWALREGLVSEDPSSFIKSVKEARSAPKALDRNEQNRLLRKSGEPQTRDPSRRPWRDLALVTLLLHTGLRVGELCALRTSDVSLSDRKGTVTVRSGKGGKYREIPLNADVRKALGEYLRVRTGGETDALFVSQKGGRLSSSAVWRIVEKQGKAAGIDLSPHTLRHTFGTNLVRQGTDLVAVAALLGHESLNTTALYTQPSQRHLAGEVQRLSALGDDEA